MGTPREKQPSAKIQWHPAFCAAAELELRSNKGDLEFKREYNLSKKPLQMDLLIIEKVCRFKMKSEKSFEDAISLNTNHLMMA